MAAACAPMRRIAGLKGAGLLEGDDALLQVGGGSGIQAADRSFCAVADGLHHALRKRREMPRNCLPYSS